MKSIEDGKNGSEGRHS